jgi:TatD DNase family protein
VIDSHCHLADEAFGSDLDEVIARAREAGLEQVLCIISADEPAEIERAHAVRARWPSVRFAVGVHPQHAAPYAGRAEDAQRITRDAAAALGAVAIGEIGLDYHYDAAPRDVQRAVCAAQLELAVERGLPVVIHTREASDDTFALLRAAGPTLRGVLHCFSGTAAEAAQGLALGFYLSFSGIVTFRKADALRAVAASAPAERLLVETDAPYLAPVPHRGRRNEPAWVLETLRALARVRGTAEADLAAQVARNLEQLLGPAAVHPTAVR